MGTRDGHSSAEIFSRGSSGLGQDLVRKDRRRRQHCVGVEQLDELYFSKGEKFTENQI